ncbi:MAG: D-alanyl-D-alanine carboxypeptidase family protein [Candidatus Harrisonbacteria bacterium]|nr:D-alanyl-D-alanine carboxypeptidase family protein [Candidatus Harrisonbacteria bacterium]
MKGLKFSARERIISGIGIFLILVLGVGAFFLMQNLNGKIDALAAQKEELENQKQSLSEELRITQEASAALSQELDRERQKNQEFEDQISDISGTVGRLDKLSKTDEELLQKYSKVYFLNEHYSPAKLTTIEEAFSYNQRDLSIHAQVWPFLEDLLEDAKDDGINLQIISSFRSFYEQSDLKGRYVVTYGAGSANQFSADQGYSEHQLGTAVDFTTEELGAVFTSIQNTEAYTWLQDNAHKYGFVLSYPENNSYYQFEPWHWRFVGRSLAKDLYRKEQFFYDLDQRTIDTYLIELFD